MSTFHSSGTTHPLLRTGCLLAGFLCAMTPAAATIGARAVSGSQTTTATSIVAVPAPRLVAPDLANALFWAEFIGDSSPSANAINTDARAFDINNQGQVLFVDSYRNRLYNVSMWDPTANPAKTQNIYSYDGYIMGRNLTDSPVMTIGTASTSAQAYVSRFEPTNPEGARWVGTSLPGSTVYGYFVNNNGAVVGHTFLDPQVPFSTQPFIWTTSSGYVRLQEVGRYPFTMLGSINDHGFVVGTVSAWGQNKPAFWNAQGRITFLPDPGIGTSAYPARINGQEQVVGSATSDSTAYTLPSYWDGTSTTPRILPHHGFGGRAEQINAYGHIVGQVSFNSNVNQRGVLWVSGQLIDLSTRVVNKEQLGLNLWSAMGINDRGEITGTHRDFSNFSSRAVVLHPLWPTLSVDANRDSQIRLASEDGSDATSPSKPFRFWVNDDDDNGDTNGDDIPNPSSSSDGAATTNFEGDGNVDGARDLVDFFPVFIDLKQLLTVLPPSASVKYKLKHEDGALNFIYTKLSRTDALKYQTEDKGANYGPTLNEPIANVGTRRIGAAGVELSDQFLTGIKDQDWGVILVEAWQPTTKPLVLVVEKDGTMMVEVKLELSIGSVEDMYRRINLRDGADAPAGLVGDLSVRDNDLGKPTSLSDEPMNFPDGLTNGKWFVFVVGSNIGGRSARGWESETFKRLHWSQSKARFVGVSWYGDPHSDGNDLVYDYHSAARNAFTTAQALTAKLNSLSGSKTIAGHSAAALIISSAIADHGLSVSNACLIDAAMARECFDGPSADDIMGMVPEIWRNYPSSLWAANWHERFDSATDARSTLTWRNRFTGAAGAVHNFYSSTEDVLARYEGTVDSSIIENLRAPGSFAWVIQEKAKGDKLRIGWFIHVGSDYGGWGFNLHDPITVNLPTWYVPNNNAQRVPKTPAQIGPVTAPILDDIKIQPLFRTGWGRYLNGNPSVVVVDTDPSSYTGPSWIFGLYGATTGNAIAADPVRRSQILNEAIPALSLAVGANPLAFSTIPSTRQYNMPAQFVDAARWPSIRGVNNTTGVAVPIWHHSDMREVAYLYLARFYDKLSSLANQ